MLVQIVSVHLTERVVFSIILGLILGFIFEIVIFISLYFNGSLFNIIDYFLISIFTYIALSFCFWAFLNLNLTSLRIRLISELVGKPDGVPSSMLSEIYTTQEMLDRRMARLERSGAIININGKWTLNSRKLLLFVYISTFLRHLIIVAKSK